jgi:transposase-like protein
MTAVLCPYCDLALWLEKLPRHCSRCDWYRCERCRQVFAANRAHRITP